MRKKDLNEVLIEIKNEIKGFDSKELLEYTKWALPRLYNNLLERNEREIIVNCTENTINKLKNEKDKFRINKDIDHIKVHYVKIDDYFKKNDEIYIKVYASIFFIDKVVNNEIKLNEERDDSSRKYWNDVWSITYKETNTKERRNEYVCNNCGATMKYMQWSKKFACDYCKSEKRIEQISNWEIVDIDVLY